MCEVSKMWNYFRGSFGVAVVGLAAAFFIGGVEALWIATVLSVLEVSLSFDNAIVNAQVLKNMDSVWKARFLTWGMLIAVGFMRLAFPLLIVSVALGINPIDSLLLAVGSPEDYKHALESSHTAVMGFGQSFLMMVALKFFIDSEKDCHWLKPIEKRLTALGKIEAVQVALSLLVSLGTAAIITTYSTAEQASTFLTASIWGLITYIAVDGLEAVIGVEESSLTTSAVRSGLASFIYLEVLDASFSFDGVISSFALTNDIFIITIGLGIGAMFVRSLTILFVDKGTIDQFAYLEHGAFWAIFGLAIIMNINTFHEISETITGLLGAAFIGASLISSYREREIES